MEVHNFDIDQIMRSGQCFRIRKISEDTYSVIHLDKYLEIKVKDNGGYIMKCSENELRRIWIPYFDLAPPAADPYMLTEQRIRASGDEFLIKAWEYGSGIRILRQDLWEAMVQFITSQRNSIPRITTTIDKLCEKWGKKHIAAGGPDGLDAVQYFSIPSPEAIAAADLEELRMSGLYYRAPYLQELAKNIVAGRINLEEMKRIREFSQLHNKLLAIKGIGTKVAACIELFGLHRMDAMPVDTWMSKIISQKYDGYFPVEKYRGYEGLVQQYMFFYALNHKDEFKEGDEHYEEDQRADS